MTKVGESNVGQLSGYGTQGGSDSQVATARYGETKLTDVAARLGVDPESLLEANPQISDPDNLKAGQDIRVPLNQVAPNAGTPTRNGGPDQPQLPSGRNSLRGDPMARSIAQWRFASSGGATVSTNLSAGATVASNPADAAASGDPRFDAVNDALHSGNGPDAMEAAQELVATLQKEKPPQPRLLDQARMSLAAAALLAGDLDSSEKAMTSIHAGKLDPAGQEQYTGLRELVKNGRRDAYSTALANDTGASDQAAKLVAFLQKTEPGNISEIDEARLKQANALLLGGNYRDAEKSIAGIHESALPPEQQEYLGAVRNAIHAQQIEALSGAFNNDMRHGKYADAVTNSRALVNDLAKNFPDNKNRLTMARLQHATAQIMNGEMEGAQKTLGRVGRDDLKQMPKNVQQTYRQLTGAVAEHFETQQKLAAVKADQAAIEKQLKEIGGLTASGDKTQAAKAVPLAEQLVATVQQKYPNEAGAIASAKLTLADTKLAAGDIQGAKAQLKEIAGTTTDPVIRDSAQFGQARVALREGQTDSGIKMLRSLSETGATPELRKAAKGVIISIESANLKNVERKAAFEVDQLEHIRISRTANGDSPIRAFNPFNLSSPGVLDDHEKYTHELLFEESGAAQLRGVMQRNNLTVEEVKKLDPKALAALPGVGPESAHEILHALRNPDVQLIARDDFQSKRFTWETNTPYVDPSYLDRGLDIAAKGLKAGWGSIREGAEDMKDHWYSWLSGEALGLVMDGVIAASHDIKDSIKTASDFYNDPERKDKWYGKLGQLATFGADMLTSPLTMPATVVDPKASTEESANALFGTLLMIGTAGILKSGGPAWLARKLGSGVSAMAGSEAGQWISRSAFGRAVAVPVKGLAKGAMSAEKWFEKTRLAQTADKVGNAIGKLNPFKLGAADRAAAGLEIHAEMPNVMFDSGIRGFNMKKVMNELERTAAGSRIADRIRSGELEVLITREDIAAGKGGLAGGSEIQVTWGGSAEETASTIIHEGSHNLDPVLDGKPVSKISREALARSEQFEYRMQAKLPAYDYSEKAYREAFAKATAGGASEAEARLAAEKALIDVLRTSPTYAGQMGGAADEMFRIGRPAPKPTKTVDQAIDEIMDSTSPRELRAKFTPQDLADQRASLFRSFRKAYPKEVTDRQIASIVNSFNDDTLRSQIVGEQVYRAVYRPKLQFKPSSISQGEFEGQLAKYEGPTATDGYWHIRENKPVGNVPQGLGKGADVRRFYFNVQPDKAAELADYLSGQLNARQIPFNFKTPLEVSNFGRADSGVMYVDKANYEAVKEIVLDFARRHPEAFDEASLAFTKPLTKGVTVAHQPLESGLPYDPLGHSFGSAYSDLIGEAMIKAPDGATTAEVKQFVGDYLRQHGFDTERPWLKQGARVDDL